MSGDPQASNTTLVGTLAAISMIAGVLVALSFKLTEIPIAKNQTRAMESAVFQVLPGATGSRGLVMEDTGARDCRPGEKPTLFAASDAAGAPVGYAIRAEARGYADTVEVLYGYSPEKQAVIGLTVLRSNETPGLGDRIGKDPAFKENFAALDVSNVAEHPVETVKHGKKTNPWQIDGISGATISSKAVGKALRESTGRMIPGLKAVPGRPPAAAPANKENP